MDTLGFENPESVSSYPHRKKLTIASNFGQSESVQILASKCSNSNSSENFTKVFDLAPCYSLPDGSVGASNVRSS